MTTTKTTTVIKQPTLKEIPRDKLYQMQKDLGGYHFSDTWHNNFYRNGVEVAERTQHDNVSSNYVATCFQKEDSIHKLYEKAIFRRDLKSSGVDINEPDRTITVGCVRTVLNALEALAK